MKVLWLVLLVVSDQILKNIISPTHGVKNYGLALSVDLGNFFNWLILVLGLIILGWYFFRKKISDYAFILILAGALPNLGDRLILGYVRDFIDLGLGFSFNLADVQIVLGLACIFFQKPKNQL